MKTQAVSAKVDEAAAGLWKSREQALASLRQEHAVGVVVALHGEVIWADIFSDTELLTRYWMKLVRSYAAEGLAAGKEHKTATLADVKQFLDGASHGRETSRRRGRSIPLPRGEDGWDGLVRARIAVARDTLRRAREQAENQRPRPDPNGGQLSRAVQVFLYSVPPNCGQRRDNICTKESEFRVEASDFW